MRTNTQLFPCFWKSSRSLLQEDLPHCTFSIFSIYLSFVFLLVINEKQKKNED